jgi:hypothetical protein
MIDLQIKFKGGKNLSKVDWQDLQYMREVVPWAAERIRQRVIQKGTTADGRALPRYGKRHTSRRKKAGLGTGVVDYSFSGQMWRSLVARITTKGYGEAGFTGSHRTADGEVQKVSRKLKSGVVKQRKLTNQMLASLLAFRQPGRSMPDHPLPFVPAFRFMDLDEQGQKEAVSRYGKYWLKKINAAPPALPTQEG